MRLSAQSCPCDDYHERAPYTPLGLIIYSHGLDCCLAFMASLPLVPADCLQASPLAMAGFTAGCFGAAYVLGAVVMAGTDREASLEKQLRARQTMDHKVRAPKPSRSRAEAFVLRLGVRPALISHGQGEVHCARR